LNNKLCKKQIISKKKEISFLLKTGLRWDSNCVRIIYKKNGIPQDRVAILVSKKNGNSVTRNKVKRIYRELFRVNKRITPPFFDYLFKPEPGHETQKEEIKSTIVTWFSNLEKDLYRFS
jgi:ribonuclease P protein component